MSILTALTQHSTEVLARGVRQETEIEIMQIEKEEMIIVFSWYNLICRKPSRFHMKEKTVRTSKWIQQSGRVQSQQANVTAKLP